MKLAISGAQLPQTTLRSRRSRCRPAAPRASGGSGEDAVRARIAAAKKYKASQTAAPPQPAVQQQTAPATQAPIVADGARTDDDVQRVFSEGAQQLAAKEEAQFLKAVAEASSSSSSSSSSSAAAPAPPAPGSGGGNAGTGSEAMLARIRAAKQYSKQEGAGGPAAAPAAAPADAQQQQQEAQQEAAAQQQQQQAEAEAQRSFRTGSGGAEQAANWLIFAEGSQQQQPDQSLSAEQFTLAKEELKKQQKVEIITAAAPQQIRRDMRAGQGVAEGGGGEVEGSAAGGEAGEGEEGDSLHKPKVATWGVFPRPKNISETYGGGRNLKPGQALESDEAAAARQQRVSAALKEYRKTLGLDVDPAVEAAAQASYDEGVKLFDQGLISSALPKFTAAVDAMALRSRLGGEARLQQAICLDSLGRNQEAYEIYKKIENHPAPGVAKKAKRMLFGWKAAENLKTQRLSYQPTTAQWKRYFDRINRESLYNNSYVASQEEAAEGGSGDVATVMAVGVALLPLAWVAWRALQQP